MKTPRLAQSFLLSLLFLSASLVIACEDVSHENIDKWSHTEKGPGKLLDALKSDKQSSALRGHAAQKLIEIDRFEEAKEILSEMEEGPRHEVMAELATRLWDMARINDAMAVPTARQVNAKDALFYTMDLADAATQAKIADYLVEWYVGGHYEGRAGAGRVSGSMAIRRVGTVAGPRLLERARGIVATPPDEEGRRVQVGDELLRALALAANKDTLEFLMELIDNPRDDTSLPKRVVSAIFFAYVEPTGIDPADPKALLAISEKLEAMPYNNSLPATMRNDAVALLAVIGAPECVPFFTRMVAYPTDQERFRWMGTQHGMRCARVQGMRAITEALPVTVDYQRGMLSKYLWDEILKYPDKNEIVAGAVALLQSDSWVARITGIELLAALGDTVAAENVKAIKALSGDGRRLKNWWGKEEEVPPGLTREPTIGEVAANVAKSLDTLASKGGDK